MSFCWLEGFSKVPCGGRTDRVHLIPKQLLKREGIRDPMDPATWVWACRQHHGMLDVTRNLRVPRDKLPERTEAFAREHGIGWYLDREYGQVPGVQDVPGTTGTSGGGHGCPQSFS